MATRNHSEDGKKTGILTALFRSSIILTSLDRFTAYIYSLLKNGLFGFIFTGYKWNSRSFIIEKIGSSKMALHFNEFRFGMCRRIEKSVILRFISTFIRSLLGCRLKTYGTFLATFGTYTLLTASIGAVATNTINELIYDIDTYVALGTILAALPLIFSKKTLSESLLTSFIGKLIINVTGFSEEEVTYTSSEVGYINVAFFLGIVFGALTYAIPPSLLILMVVAGVWAYLVLLKPELGVMTLFFTMPFFPTMLLAAVVVYTTISYFLKIYRGKRVVKFAPVDIMAVAFMVLVFFGGTVSLSDGSIKPALLMVCLMLGYFLTVGLIRTRPWLIRCSVAAVIAATLCALYGIFVYYTGGGYSSQAWLDSEMFESISGRAVSTLENPNMLGEYLILIIPIAVSMFVGRGEGLRKSSAFLCIGIMGVCLILTWSRGAWLGLIFAALVFLFMWTRRSLWIVFALIVSIPFLPLVLPESIVSRFTSIGNLGDSSTSYRMYIWRAVINMIEDFSMTGIGIGEGAWDRVYPMYAFLGVEAAPHSHNLFLQIWLELGIVGIVVFLGFVFLLYQSGFSLFAKLSTHSGLMTPDISERLMLDNFNNYYDDSIGDVISRGKTQLRISVAGPLCGVIAVLAQGLTDYSWYNYRLFLMFWLVCGLAAAYARNGNGMIRESYDKMLDATSCEKEISLDTLNSTKNKRTEKKEK